MARFGNNPVVADGAPKPRKGPRFGDSPFVSSAAGETEGASPAQQSEYVPIPGMVLPETGTQIVSPTGARMIGGPISAVAGGALAGPPGAAAGLALGGEAFGQAAELINQYVGGVPDDRNVLERTREAGQNIMLDVVGMKAGEMIGQGIMRGWQRLKTPAALRPGEEAVDAGVARALSEEGIPTGGAAAMIVDDDAFRLQLDVLSKMPGSSEIMRAGQKETETGLRQLSKKALAQTRRPEIAATRAGAATATEAGEYITEGLGKYVTHTMEVAETRFAGVRGLDELRVPLSREAVDVAGGAAPGQSFKEFAEFLIVEENKGLPDDGVMRMLKTVVAKADEIDFGTARVLRSNLLTASRGKKVDNPKHAADVAARLVGVLDEAMEASAKRGLESSQFASWRTTNAWYAGRMERIARLSPVLRAMEKMQEGPESVYSVAVTQVGRGATRLKAVKDSLRPDDWNEVRHYFVASMFKETPRQSTTGALQDSLTEFAAKWVKLVDNGVADVIAPKGSTMRRGLDNSALLGGAARGQGMMKNHPKTAISNFFVRALTLSKETAVAGAGAGIAGTMVGGPIAGAAGVAGVAVGRVALEAAQTLRNRSVAKLVASPMFSKWLENGMKAPPSDPKGWAAHMGRLFAIAEVQPALRDPIMWYAENLQGLLGEAGDALSPAMKQGAGAVGAVGAVGAAMPAAPSTAQQNAAAGVPSAGAGMGMGTGWAQARPY